jgi:aspartate dehydrogenase
VRSHAAAVLAAGCDILLSSVGALADEAVLTALTDAARRADTQLFVCSGALVGIDALAAARHVGLAQVRYERRAPPATWVRSGAIGPEKADAAEAFEVFSGTAREAALRFPKNANVAATLALAGVGFDATRVVLIADPAHSGNTHTIHAEGAFGTFRTEISARTLSATSTSSRIVAGSLARAVLAHEDRIVV